VVPKPVVGGAGHGNPCARAPSPLAAVSGVPPQKAEGVPPSFAGIKAYSPEKAQAAFGVAPPNTIHPLPAHVFVPAQATAAPPAPAKVHANNFNGANGQAPTSYNVNVPSGRYDLPWNFPVFTAPPAVKPYPEFVSATMQQHQAFGKFCKAMRIFGHNVSVGALYTLAAEFGLVPPALYAQRVAGASEIVNYEIQAFDFMVTAAPEAAATGNPDQAGYVGLVFAELLRDVIASERDNTLAYLAAKVKKVMDYVHYGTFRYEISGLHTAAFMQGGPVCAVATLPHLLAYAKNLVQAYLYGDGLPLATHLLDDARCVAEIILRNLC
jgi:hypothetical protein